MYKGIIRTRSYRPPVERPPKPKRNPKLERALAKAANLAETKKKLEKNLKNHEKPIKEFRKIQQKKGEAIRNAKSWDEKLRVGKEVEAKGKISYDQFVAARKDYDEIKSEIFSATIEEAKVQAEVDMLKPPEVKPQPGFLGWFLMTGLVLWFLMLMFG